MEWIYQYLKLLLDKFLVLLLYIYFASFAMFMTML